MLRIAICDDDIIVHEQITEYIHQFCFQKNKEVKTHCFSSAEALLDAPFDYNILFLDIMLDNHMDGIEVGKILRQKNNQALFIVTTSRSDKYAEAIEATVFRYLVKPLDQEKINKVLDEAIRFMEGNERYFPVHFRQRIDYVPISQILTIESYQRNRWIKTKESTYQTTETWKVLLDRLSNEKCFYRIQKMLMINMQHVRTTTKAFIIMDNGREISLGKNGYKQFQEAFNGYLGDLE